MFFGVLIIYMASPDVLIIGGGIIGCASAFYLSRVGFKCAILERRPDLGGLTTGASVQAFRAQFTEPENIAMMRDSICVYENFSEEVGQKVEIGLRQQGYLFATTREDGPLIYQARTELQHDLGLKDVDYLEGDSARKAFPYLAPEVTAATFREKDGWLSAGEVTRAYARQSRAALHLETSVTGFRLSGSQIIGLETSAGFLPGEQVVLAAGPFSRPVALMAGHYLPLVNLRRHRLIITHDPRVPNGAPMTIDADTGAHWRPEGKSGACLAWGEAEAPSEPADPVEPDPEFPERVLKGVCRLSPFFGEVGANPGSADFQLHAGQYTITPDHKPLIGRQGPKGLWLNTGYSGHGIMGAPAGARLLSALMSGSVDRADNPFSPDRPSLSDPTAHEILML